MKIFLDNPQQCHLKRIGKEIYTTRFKDAFLETFSDCFICAKKDKSLILLRLFQF